MGFPVLLGQAPHMILGYTTVASHIVLKNNIYSHSTKAYCCFYSVSQKSHGTTNSSTRNTLQQWLRKCCSADPKGSATSSQGFCGYISVMNTLKFTCLLIDGNMFY